VQRGIGLTAIAPSELPDCPSRDGSSDDGTNQRGENGPTQDHSEYPDATERTAVYNLGGPDQFSHQRQ
jgi:hypothetical protein